MQSVVQDNAQTIISLRDKLLLRKRWLEDQALAEENAQKVVASQLRTTARCLENAGVEIMDESDAFDSRCQTVVETRLATALEQEDQIVETFRLGYWFQGEVLRSQEVILFTKE